MLPNFQRGLEHFKDNALPHALRSSCLALVAKQQEIHRNPLLSSQIPSPNKKHYMDQVSHLQGLDAVPNSEKDQLIGQLTQVNYESQNGSKCSVQVTECPNESNNLCTDLPVTSILVASMQIDLAFIANQLLSQKIQAILSRYFTMKVNDSTVIKLHIFHQ